LSLSKQVPCYKSDNKVKLHDGNQLISLMQPYPVNLRAMQLMKMRVSFDHFLACLLVNKSLILNGNCRDFSKRGPGICHLQNRNSRWPCGCFET